MPYCLICGTRLISGQSTCPKCGRAQKNSNRSAANSFSSHRSVLLGHLNKKSSKTATNFKKIAIAVGVVTIAVMAIFYVNNSDNTGSFQTYHFDSQESASTNLIESVVVNVSCLDTRTEDYQSGSGTIMGPNGVVLTNFHVLPHDNNMLYLPEDGCIIGVPQAKTGQIHSAYLAKPIIKSLNEYYDLALLLPYAVLTEDGSEELSDPHFVSLMDGCENHNPTLDYWEL